MLGRQLVRWVTNGDTTSSALKRSRISMQSQSAWTRHVSLSPPPRPGRRCFLPASARPTKPNPTGRAPRFGEAPDEAAAQPLQCISFSPKGPIDARRCPTDRTGTTRSGPSGTPACHVDPAKPALTPTSEREKKTSVPWQVLPDTLALTWSLPDRRDVVVGQLLGNKLNWLVDVVLLPPFRF